MRECCVNIFNSSEVLMRDIKKYIIFAKADINFNKLLFVIIYKLNI
jgi:hypothetical protein